MGGRAAVVTRRGFVARVDMVVCHVSIGLVRVPPEMDGMWLELDDQLQVVAVWNVPPVWLDGHRMRIGGNDTGVVA